MGDIAFTGLASDLQKGGYMRDYSEQRVIFYGRNDYAASVFRDRCRSLLANAESIDLASINDAIEAHQIKLTVEGIPELFQDQLIDDFSMQVQVLFSKACKFISAELKSKDIGEIFNQIELQYVEEFWKLLEACGAWRKIKASEFEKLLICHPECLGIVLRYKESIVYFSDEIKQALVWNPTYSAELIVSRLATETTQESIYLPHNLENSEIDCIMLSYINSGDANPNHLSALRDWPSGKVAQYNPSPEVRVQAKRQYDRSIDDLFQNGAGLGYGAGVIIDMNQRACKGVTREGFYLTYSFSGSWLRNYTDPATVMNNLIYVFDFVDTYGLMQAPARQHEEHAILATLGMHVKGEYRRSTGFEIRSDLTYVEAMAYADFLEANGVRLESAIEWVYNQYFVEEFSIAGFSLALPSQKATWLDKCKAIGPEIERAVKAYSLFSKYGVIEDEYFPHESVKSFSSIIALKDKKYAIAGPDFERFASVLFSDQCMLSYLHTEQVSESCFFEVMERHFITQDDYPEYLHAAIRELIDKGLIIERDEDGRLLPTERAICLEFIWEHDALPIYRLGMTDLELIESLAASHLVSYCDKLFAPFEASYLDYMFNDASFPNSIGLRNRYDHAHSSIKNPQADDIKIDYFRLLSLLISVTLKINEELMEETGRGGLDSFVDWPYYDESVVCLARELEQQGKVT